MRRGKFQGPRFREEDDDVAVNLLQPKGQQPVHGACPAPPSSLVHPACPQAAEYWQMVFLSLLGACALSP